MSADNWRECPRCLGRHRKQVEAALVAVREQYGKVTPEEYEAAKERHSALLRTRIGQTFREDYEIGTDTNGEFSVGYRGGCDECGYLVTFTEKRTVAP